MKSNEFATGGFGCGNVGIADAAGIGIVDVTNGITGRLRHCRWTRTPKQWHCIAAIDADTGDNQHEN
jgi:hypothetical protein